jgi:hypothetical protein
MDSNKKYQLYIDSRSFVQKPANHYINVYLFKTNTIEGYINVSRDATIQVVERQEINPYFIEIGFFDGIQRNKINYGIDLTKKMIDFIRKSRPDIDVMFPIDFNMQQWFDIYGQYELPWGTITLNDIQNSDQETPYQIISKAAKFSININN